MAIAQLKVAIDFIVSGLERIAEAGRALFSFQAGIQKMVIPSLKDLGIEMTKSGKYVVKGMKGFQDESVVVQKAIDALGASAFDSVAKFDIMGLRQQQLGQMAYDLGTNIEGLEEKMKLTGITLLDTGDWFSQTMKSTIPYKKALGLLSKAHKRFRMEMLSVMFFGMQMTRVFGQWVDSVLEMTGVTELFNVTMQMMVLEVIDPVIDAIVWLSDTLMDLPEPAKKALGMFILFGNVMGNVLFFIGAMVLGLGGLASAFGGIAGVIAIPGMAAIFTLVATMLGITNEEALLLIGTLGGGVGAVLGFGKTIGDVFTKVSDWLGKKNVVEFIEKGLSTIWDTLVSIKDKIVTVTANFIDNVSYYLGLIKDKIITVWTNFTSNFAAWFATLPAWAQTALVIGAYAIIITISFLIGFDIGKFVANLVGLKAGENFWTTFGKSLATVGAGAAGGAAIGAAVGSVVPGIGTAVGAVVGGIAGAIGAGLGGADKVITESGSSWQEELGKVGTNISNWFTHVSSTVQQGAENLRTVVTARFDEVKTGLQSWADETKSNIGNWVENAKTTISSGWDNIKSGMSTTLTNIGTATSNTWNNIKNSISTSLGSIGSSISTWGTNAWNTITNAWNNIKNTISNFLSNIWQNITNVFSNIVNGIYTWGTNFVNNLVRGIVDFGWKIADALWNLIPEPFKSAIRWGTNIVVNVVQTITKAIVKGVGAQAGGIFTKPAVTLIAEKGPEAAIPLTKGVTALTRAIAEGMEFPRPALTLLSPPEEMAPAMEQVGATILYQPTISIAATVSHEVDINRMMSKVDDYIIGKLKSITGL